MNRENVTDEEDFVLSLILEEEKRQTAEAYDGVQMRSMSEEEAVSSEEGEKAPAPVETDPDRDELFLINEKNVTKSNYFTPSGTDAEHNPVNLPVKGEGRLDNLVIISPSPNFSVTVEVDESNPIDDSFSYVQSVSTELTHASAYTDGTQHVFHVSDYPFNEHFSATVVPEEEITFDLIRIEAIKEAVSREP